jgi:hypothetical protein
MLTAQQQKLVDNINRLAARYRNICQYEPSQSLLEHQVVLQGDVKAPLTNDEVKNLQNVQRGEYEALNLTHSSVSKEDKKSIDSARQYANMLSCRKTIFPQLSATFTIICSR